MTPSRILLASCLFFIGGIGFAPFVPLNLATGGIVFILGIFLITVFWKYKVVASAGVAIIIVVLGIARYNTEESATLSFHEPAFNTNREVVFRARVAEDPDERPNNIQFVLESEAIPEEKILVTLDKTSDYQYGDIVQASGKLQIPPIFDDFDYREYLARQRISYVMYRPELELLERGEYQSIFSGAYAFVLGVKHKFRDVLQSHIRPPQSTILGAILLGDKSALGDETKEKLNAAGVRHITAISGLHVSIFTILLMRFLIWIGLWRQQAFYATVLLMIFFIVLTGLQPSAARAGIMGGMFLLGQHIGRLNVSLRALLFAATIMLGLNPLLLGDVGFQLSFLAVLGIILFLPIFQHLSRNIPNKLHVVRDLVAMTISAQIFTLPILIYNFGYVSLVSLIANVLIVPMLPFLLPLGFIFLIGGALFEPLGFFLSIPVIFLLSYLTLIVDFLSQLPFAAVSVQNLSPFWLVLFYIPIGAFYWKFRWRQEFPSSYF